MGARLPLLLVLLISGERLSVPGLTYTGVGLILRAPGHQFCLLCWGVSGREHQAFALFSTAGLLSDVSDKQESEINQSLRVVLPLVSGRLLVGVCRGRWSVWSFFRVLPKSVVKKKKKKKLSRCRGTGHRVFPPHLFLHCCARF